MNQTDSDVENENEPAHFRAAAAFWVAHWYTRTGSQMMNVNTAAEIPPTRLGDSRIITQGRREPTSIISPVRALSIGWSKYKSYY
jgi:hypothetical protein